MELPRRVAHAELDAWVGLCLYKEGAGHMCCCQVPPAAAGCNTTTMPAWKLGLDAFFDAQSELHNGATLVYKGDISSRFCLVECQRLPGYRRRLRVLKMTDFVLKYDKDGELRSGRHRAFASRHHHPMRCDAPWVGERVAAPKFFDDRQCNLLLLDEASSRHGIKQMSQVHGSAWSVCFVDEKSHQHGFKVGIEKHSKEGFKGTKEVQPGDGDAPTMLMRGFQLGNNLLQFDLEKMHLGFAKLPFFTAFCNFNFIRNQH
ncbi:hypothetical protein PR202_gb03811 [Eleusine coracana subsp. coracana]|uniref:Peptidase A1 domain-containing protein n=1 Tax=Eleusine coracana subsp. coracana TaxID=191504 RepID=A0AAV5E2E5_ELECO|nr:hypothetical protein PR202_gb03811 [Eleusine coracana subsp. coracana]